MRSPSGMLKVWEWLTASGLHDIKSVINGCHTVLSEWTTGEQVFHRINAQLWSSFQHWEIKSGCFSPSMNDHLLACGTQRLLLLITDLMISVETQDRSSLSPVREFRMWRGRGWVIAASATGRSRVMRQIWCLSPRCTLEGEEAVWERSSPCCTPAQILLQNHVSLTNVWFLQINASSLLK